MADDKPYVLGHSAHEIRRLELQSIFLQPPTLRLLQAVGLAEGLSVLDVGTGAGDVAMLAAEMVGPGGKVVAIDRDAGVLDRARDRARAGGLAQIEFARGDLDAAAAFGRFDLVVGRFVLIFQPDVPAFLREAAALVTPGGALAFLETMVAETDRHSTPPAPLHDWTMRKLLKGFEVGRADIDVGSRLAALFHAAGLPEPRMFAEMPMGTASTPLPEWASATLQSLAPALQAAGELEPMDFDAHTRALRDEARATRSQLYGPRAVGAWARIG